MTRGRLACDVFRRSDIVTIPRVSGVEIVSPQDWRPSLKICAVEHETFFNVPCYRIVSS